MAIEAYNYNMMDTRTFAEIFPSDEEFEDFYEDCGIPQRLLTGQKYTNYGIRAIYALLIANYANDHIASYDENRFKLKVMQIIFEAAPAWQRAMAVQDELLNMSDANIHKGSKMEGRHYVRWDKSGKSINNDAQHPDTEPSTNTDEELPYISSQRVSKDTGWTTDDGSQSTEWTKDNLQGLVELLYALDDTLVSRFVYRFKGLFVKVACNSQPPLIFEL